MTTSVIPLSPASHMLREKFDFTTTVKTTGIFTVVGVRRVSVMC